MNKNNIRADERKKVNAEWSGYIQEARKRNPYQGTLKIGDKREKATWKHCFHVWENALNTMLEVMNDKLLSGGENSDKTLRLQGRSPKTEADEGNIQSRQSRRGEKELKK